MKVFIKIFTFILFFNVLHASEGYRKFFGSPVDIPKFLSANFAEIRPNAFHAGIDIKTQGKIGKRVHASASGEVSRIRVSPVGYGRAIYINHLNGYTTVYAHLERFAPIIEEYVRNAQYSQQSFEIDLYPEQGKFRFEKGELIGISGNTGSSTGPHVHFEIRKTKGQIPINPLLFDFNIKDNIAPILEYLAIYPLCDFATVNEKHEKIIIPVALRRNTYGLQQNITIEVSGKIGFGIDAFDYKIDSWNKCGVYSVELFVNGDKIYEHRFDEIPFHDMRYVNSHIDYEELMRTRRIIKKTFIEPGNRLAIYRNTVNNGIIEFNKPGEHNVEIITKDAHQNSSILQFKVISHPVDSTRFRNTISGNFVRLMPFDQNNSFKTNNFEVTINKGTLYNDLFFEYVETDSSNDFFSGIHHVHNIFTPLHRNIRISVSAKNIPEQLLNKAILVNLNRNKTPASIGGFHENGFITSHTNSFGRFTIMIDTISPTIQPVNISNNRNMSAEERIEFKIDDELSGIKKFRGYINGEWALFEYDPKNKLLFFEFKHEPQRGIKHKLYLYVIDERDNTNSIHLNFYR